MLLVRTQRIPMSQLALARFPLRVYSITTSPAPLSSGEQSAMLGIAVKVRWGGGLAGRADSGFGPLACKVAAMCKYMY